MLTKTEASSKITITKTKAFDRMRDLAKGKAKPPKGVSVGDALLDIVLDSAADVDAVLVELIEQRKH